MGKKKRVIEYQSLDERSGNTNSYERYVASSKDGENVLANPDKFLFEKDISPTSPQQIMGEAIQHLQGRQREVYLLIMREDKSMAEAAEILDIGKSTVQTYLDRAIAFITAYCKVAIDGGRV